VPRTSHPARAGARTPQDTWGRPDTGLLALTATTLVLVAAQFALAGFGAFAMVKSPADHAYAAHMVLGLVIGVLTWLILVATLASRPARAHPRTLRPAMSPSRSRTTSCWRIALGESPKTPARSNADAERRSRRAPTIFPRVDSKKRSCISSTNRTTEVADSPDFP